MEFLYEYGLFLAKVITFVIAVVVILVVIAATAMKQKQKKGELEITDLSEQFIDVEDEMLQHLLTKDELKDKDKADKKLAKQKWFFFRTITE